QSRVAMVLVEATVEVVIALAGDVLDLDRALGRALRPRRGRRDGNFLNRVQARVDATVEAIGSLVVVILYIDAVEGDVQGALGKTVDGRVARRGRRVHARQHDDEITRIAGDERKINDLVDEQGSGDVSRLRLHHLAAAMDNDGFV